jgi:hypothetical protein
MSTPEDIDTDFMKLVKKAKQLLAVDYVDELKGEQAEMLREVLAEIMVYVQQKIQEESESEEAVPAEEEASVEEQEPIQPQPAQPLGAYQAPLPGTTPTPSSMMMSAGARKKGTRKQKGGDINVAANIDRVLNSEGIPNVNNDPHNISSNSRDTVIAGALHPAFTAGRVQPMSSMVGLTDTEKLNMLPNVGGQSGGGRKKRLTKK